jgi:hypothetical protein
MKNKSTYMGTASEKLCLQNNIYVIWKFSFIENTGVKSIELKKKWSRTQNIIYI